jgi:hypothetical protein
MEKDIHEEEHLYWLHASKYEAPRMLKLLGLTKGLKGALYQRRSLQWSSYNKR